MRILFLDIDGVVNTIRTEILIEGYTFVEDEKIQLIKDFVEEYDLKIVLSSTWRYGWIYKEKYKDFPLNELSNETVKDIVLFEALEKKFQEFGLSFYSKTPMISEYFRGAEIDKWLEENEVENFVIFDDNNKMKPHGSHLVQTSFIDGIQPKHIKKAIKILEG